MFQVILGKAGKRSHGPPAPTKPSCEGFTPARINTSTAKASRQQPLGPGGSPWYVLLNGEFPQESEKRSAVGEVWGWRGERRESVS